MSLRSFFKKLLPEPHHVRDHQHLRWLGARLHDPDLWHLSRRSTAGGVATGLFIAFLPVPLHMVLASIAAFFFRVNLPLAALMTWTSNPLTFPPILLFAYKLGVILLQKHPEHVHLQFTLGNLQKIYTMVWEPLLLGCLLLAFLSSLIGYLAVSMAWRVAVLKKLGARRLRKTQKKP